MRCIQWIYGFGFLLVSNGNFAVKYNHLSDLEAAEALILDEYKENLVNNTEITTIYTKHIVNSMGRAPMNPMQMMSYVNTLIKYKKSTINEL